MSGLSATSWRASRFSSSGYNMCARDCASLLVPLVDATIVDGSELQVLGVSTTLDVLDYPKLTRREKRYVCCVRIPERRPGASE